MTWLRKALPCASILVLAALMQSLAGAAAAQEPELGDIETADLAFAAGDGQSFAPLCLAVDPRRFLPPDACNGGSCLPASSSTSLSCPTSGGPNCTSQQSCLCTCSLGTNGSWAASNQCQAPD